MNQAAPGHIHTLSAEAVYAALHSGPDGLGTAQAQRRLTEFGPNRLQAPVHRRRWRELLASFTHFFALVLWLAAALAFGLGWRDPGSGLAALGYAIVAVIVLNGLFSYWQAYQAERAIAALEKLLPPRVRLRRDGEVCELPAEAVVPGDLLLLSGGDRVPADCRLVAGFGVQVDSSALTGESLPLRRSAQPCEAVRNGDADNLLHAGTVLLTGEGQALVFATGMHTQFGQIARLAQAEPPAASPLQREIARLSRLVTGLAIGLGVLCFAIGGLAGLPAAAGLTFAIGIIVANVPEGLLPTVTLALAMAARRMAARQALVRHLPAVEALGAATVIITDKTGTLTENRMTVRRLFVDGAVVEVPAPGPVVAAQRALFEAAALCHDLKGDPRRDATLLGDPLELALLRLARTALGDLPDWPRLDELPFESDRRRQGVLLQSPGGPVLYVKGALEALLPLCHAQAGPDGVPRPLDAAARQRLQAAEADFAAQGFRVLALAGRRLPADTPRADWEQALTLLGLVACEDPPRAEVPQAVADCRRAGIRVMMATGDHPATALAVARQIGLADATATVIDGPHLAHMSDAELHLALDAPELLFARVSAAQKLRLVQAFRRKGEVVAVTGDGVNDAPALRHADIGIAMGRSGTDVARAAADLVLADDNFASIVAAVQEGRAVYDNIRKFLTYILTSNVPEIVPYLGFVLLGVPLPLTVPQILAVDLGTDILPALALGAEPAERGVMDRPPRPRGERLLDGRLLARAYGFLGPLQAAAAMAAWYLILRAGGWHWGQVLASDAPLYRQATSACLATIVVLQVVNVFVCRSARQSIVRTGIAGNRLLWWGVGLELALLGGFLYTPVGWSLLGTAPLPGWLWLGLLPLALGLLLAEELRKGLARTLLANTGKAGTGQH